MAKGCDCRRFGDGCALARALGTHQPFRRLGVTSLSPAASPPCPRLSHNVVHFSTCFSLRLESSFHRHANVTSSVTHVAAHRRHGARPSCSPTRLLLRPRHDLTSYFCVVFTRYSEHVLEIGILVWFAFSLLCPECLSHDRCPVTLRRWAREPYRGKWNPHCLVERYRKGWIGC